MFGSALLRIKPGRPVKIAAMFFGAHMEFTFTLPQDYGASSPKKDLTLPEGEREVLLHSCCAPCSTAVLECMIANGIRPQVFFCNPNIQPQDEYEKRRDEWLRLCGLLKLETAVDPYDTAKWFECIKGFEDEPERGRRCDRCFAFRLTRAARFAKERGIRVFTTTLATSRWKSKPQVDRAGRAAQDAVPGTLYWDIDWRKEGLVGRRYELVKEIGFYNQRYCGCVYSMKSVMEQKKIREKREILKSSLDTDELSGALTK